MKSKSEIRAFIAEQKKRYSAEQCRQASAGLFERIERHPAFLSAQCIFIYYSMEGEVYTHSFIERWCAEKTILLPVVVGRTLELRAYHGGEMQKSKFGVLEPVGKAWADYEAIDLAIVPGVAFTMKGDRVGYGGGYYDRTLPLLSAYTIGVCYDFQLFPTLPTEIHDQRLDEVLSAPISSFTL